MKRFHADIISEHEEGSLMLYTDAQAAIKEAVEKEREACVKAIATVKCAGLDMIHVQQLIKAIRARGE